jgi:hypothetical protein
MGCVGPVPEEATLFDDHDGQGGRICQVECAILVNKYLVEGSDEIQ